MIRFLAVKRETGTGFVDPVAVTGVLPGGPDSDRDERFCFVVLTSGNFGWIEERAGTFVHRVEQARSCG